METHSNILAGESHGQRSLAGYSPQDHKESDMTEVNICIYMYVCMYVYIYILFKNSDALPKSR